MRMLLVLTIIVMALGLLAFSMNNLGTAVTTQMRLWEVVGIAVLIGVIATSVIAVAEGTKTRLDNRRLRREVHKLETELNFLRTQPSMRKPAAEPESAKRTEASGTPEKAGRPPTAPVYHTDPGGGSGPDDEPYTGGRAV